MKKRIAIAIVGLILVIGALGGVKALQIGKMIDQGKKFVPPPETITTAAATDESWEAALTSVGTLNAVQGVTVAAEIAGKVVKIAFEPGKSVAKGELLLQQDTSTEEAQLPGALAQAQLARSNQKRAEQLLAEKIISQVDHDTAVATYQQAQAQVDSIRAAIGKKTIRAPFSGHLGIRQANLGQMLREGDPIVTLQTLDPIYVDFTLPQQQLARLKSGQTVRVVSDTQAGAFSGRITAINPQVDADTRNVKAQATVANRGGTLRPGMFVTVSVALPGRQKIVAIPGTAVLYAPYSDSVFVVEKAKDGKGDVLRQQFVKLGEKRGDFVAVTSGLKSGETVVSTGVFKLRNGQSVVVDNKLAPQFQQNPKPENN